MHRDRPFLFSVHRDLIFLFSVQPFTRVSSFIVIVKIILRDFVIEHAYFPCILVSFSNFMV